MELAWWSKGEGKHAERNSWIKKYLRGKIEQCCEKGANSIVGKRRALKENASKRAKVR